MEGFVGLIACMLCAVPFLIVSCFGRDSKTPIVFWAGDTSLSGRITNLTEYNAKMAKLYGRCAAAFVITGVCSLISIAAAMVLLSAECTAGLYIVYKAYKKILNDYLDTNEER